MTSQSLARRITKVLCLTQARLKAESICLLSRGRTIWWTWWFNLERISPRVRKRGRWSEFPICRKKIGLCAANTSDTPSMTTIWKRMKGLGSHFKLSWGSWREIIINWQITWKNSVKAMTRSSTLLKMSPVSGSTKKRISVKKQRGKRTRLLERLKIWKTTRRKD
jgi:hypothetical protein